MAELWLTPITVPEGESVQPVSVITTEPTCSGSAVCPLVPGRYDAVLAQDVSDFPTAESVPVRVVAAPG